MSFHLSFVLLLRYAGLSRQVVGAVAVRLGFGGFLGSVQV